MNDYNFWADLLASYRASPDLIKALWVLVPPAFLLGLVAALRLTPWRMRREAEGSSGAVIGKDDRPVALRRYETAVLPLPDPGEVELLRLTSGRSPSR
jgi:hypothetical protein